jgi:negative regulator of replication initiation
MEMAMHRLQISLPEWQYRFLREQASHTGQSIADFIRKLIEKEAQTVQRPIEADPIWEVVGIGRGGPPYDVSDRVDEFLYRVQSEDNGSENRPGR